MTAKTLFGLEEVLAKELKQLGAMDVEVITRGVTFKGDMGFMYKANLWLRTAVRILVPIAQFKARDADNMYRKLKDIAWEELFDCDKTIAVSASTFKTIHDNSLFVAQKAKDAIVDRFRDIDGNRPSVDTRNPDVRIDLYLYQENVVVSLDSSGQSLHKRGYREADAAPINEVLAAGILKMMDWTGLGNLIDPMCGSGTFLIEGALMAHNIPPGVFRKDNFSFLNWKNFDSDLYELLFEKALEKEKNFHYKILGFDNDSRVLLKAGKNLRSALMEDQIKLEKADITNFNPVKEIPRPGMLIMNPPYGIKLEADIPVLYEGIGRTLKHQFAGYQAWMISPSIEGIKKIGLRPSKKIKLVNGSIECWLLRYDLYEGSKKAKKQGNREKQ